MESSNLPSRIPTSDLASFLNNMASLEHQGGPRLSLAQVDLAGKEGKWYENSFDEATKQYKDTLFQDYTDASFTISPLLMTYFCKWKYELNAQQSFETTEFIKTEGNPLELYRVIFGTETARGKRELIQAYPDYQAFKAEHATLDKLTGKLKAPYDFYTVIYGFHHLSGRVIRMEMKGASRGAWFDFQPHIKSNPEVKAMCQARIRVGVEREVAKTGDTYYRASFGFESLNDVAAMEVIMQATNDLLAYLAYKRQKNPMQPSVAPQVEPQIPIAPPQVSEPVVHIQAPVPPQAPSPASVIHQPSNTNQMLNSLPRRENEPEIRLEDIPF